MQTQLKLKLTALSLCFFLTFSLSDADEHNQMETLESLLRKASNTLIAFINTGSLTMQQYDALSVWNNLIETSLASLHFGQNTQIRTIMNEISENLPNLKLSVKQTQTIIDIVDEIIEQNQVETVERLLRDASNFLVALLTDETLTTPQHKALNEWKNLIDASLKSLGPAEHAQVLKIVAKIRENLPNLNLSSKQTQTITDIVNEINKAL